MEKCCREVLERSVIEKCVCYRSTDKKCRQMHSYLSMTLFATFAFDLLGYPISAISNNEKNCRRKIDTNAQWFHCSWSILLKRVNIRVRGFHLVFWKMTIGDWKHFETHLPGPQFP